MRKRCAYLNVNEQVKISQWLLHSRKYFNFFKKNSYHQEVLSFRNQTFHFYSQKHVQIQKVVV